MMRRSWLLAVVVLTFLAQVAAAQQSLDLKPGTKPIEVKAPSRKKPVSYSPGDCRHPGRQVRRLPRTGAG